jgi:hypothetical protein
MLVIGAMFALGMAIAGVSVIHGAGEASGTSEPLINRDEPPLSETEPRISDREQLKRYFLQDQRNWPRR